MTSTDVLVGAKQIADFFGLNLTQTYLALKWGGIPGATQLPTKRGGKPTWVLSLSLADYYKKFRAYTPKYRPSKVTQRLTRNLGGGQYKNIPQLMKAGLLTEQGWCEALDEERGRCNMDVPILMHPLDFATWLSESIERRKQLTLRYETQRIFDGVVVGEEEEDDDLGE